MGKEPIDEEQGSPSAKIQQEGGREGVVAAVFSGRYLVWMEEREWVCSLRGRRRLTPPIVGDRVMVTTQPDGSGTILSLLPRHSSLVRRSAHRGRRSSRQELAANVEQLVIVAAIREPPFRPGLVERLLVAAAMAGLSPLICITKIDLDSGGEFEGIAGTYQKLGLPVVGTSLDRKESLLPLERALEGKTSVLAGHSGVGKTSLLNSLAQREMAVGTLGGQQGDRGRHTTSTARLIPLRQGGFVIDSPGIREFGLYGLEPDSLARLYPDFQPHLEGCGFRDCLHRSEPRCAVQAAVETGQIAEARYKSYLTLLEELMEG